MKMVVKLRQKISKVSRASFWRMLQKMKTTNKTIACYGCQALVPDIDGPIHPYIGAAPGCWAIYGEVLAREYGEYRYPAVHRLTVDAYAAQHPGVLSRQSIQSVAIHLISLFLMIERGFDSDQATEAIRRTLKQRDRFVWLEPPALREDMTILDVHRAGNVEEHATLVRKWSAAVWAAWAPHHTAVARWAKVPG